MVPVRIQFRLTGWHLRNGDNSEKITTLLGTRVEVNLWIIQIVNQYGFSFSGSNVHPWYIWAEKGPSVTARRIYEFVHFLMNFPGISNECNLNEISCAPCEYGASTYSWQIFRKKFDFASFSVDPWGLENSHFNKPNSDVITKIITMVDHATL